MGKSRLHDIVGLGRPGAERAANVSSQFRGMSFVESGEIRRRFGPLSLFRAANRIRFDHGEMLCFGSTDNEIACRSWHF